MSNVERSLLNAIKQAIEERYRLYYTPYYEEGRFKRIRLLDSEVYGLWESIRRERARERGG